MSNLDIYNKVKTVPAEAKKEIQAGRLKGKTDINPMWRIRILTEQFGPCGFGWKYKITNQWTQSGGKDEVSAFVNIELFVKLNGEWSESIPGTGGSSFVASEKNGLYTSDECFKMALTDAISVACKALGVGADVYWQHGSKYTQDKPNTSNKNTTDDKEEKSNLTEKQIKRLWALAHKAGQNETAIHKWVKAKFNKESVKELTKVEYDAICTALEDSTKKSA